MPADIVLLSSKHKCKIDSSEIKGEHVTEIKSPVSATMESLRDLKTLNANFRRLSLLKVTHPKANLD